MDKRELALFLRGRRERLQPGDLGITAQGSRRTPGLRREEVARLANISVEYLSRLEQGRGPRPSPQVLSGLTRALRLNDDERSYLHVLASESEDETVLRSDVPEATVALLGWLTDVAAFVVNARYDVIAWNRMATLMLDDFALLSGRWRNLAYRHFLHPVVEQRHYGLTGADYFSRYVVGQLRSASGRYPRDTGLRQLVAELHQGSEEFARLWDAHTLELGEHQRKTMVHPEVGVVTVHCDMMAVPNRDQLLVTLAAEAGSESERKMRLLGVAGGERAAAEAAAG